MLDSATDLCFENDGQAEEKKGLEENDVEYESDIIAPIPIKSLSEEDVLSPDSKMLIEQAEDSGNFELRQRLVTSKLARKKAETDKKILQNRLQTLKAFEEKVGYHSRISRLYEELRKLKNERRKL